MHRILSHRGSVNRITCCYFRCLRLLRCGTKCSANGMKIFSIHFSTCSSHMFANFSSNKYSYSSNSWEKILHFFNDASLRAMALRKTFHKIIIHSLLRGISSLYVPPRSHCIAKCSDCYFETSYKFKPLVALVSGSVTITTTQSILVLKIYGRLSRSQTIPSLCTFPTGTTLQSYLQKAVKHYAFSSPLFQ